MARFTGLKEDRFVVDAASSTTNRSSRPGGDLRAALVAGRPRVLAMSCPTPSHWGRAAPTIPASADHRGVVIASLTAASRGVGLGGTEPASPAEPPHPATPAGANRPHHELARGGGGYARPNALPGVSAPADRGERELHPLRAVRRARGKECQGLGRSGAASGSSGSSRRKRCPGFRGTTRRRSPRRRPADLDWERAGGIREERGPRCPALDAAHVRLTRSPVAASESSDARPGRAEGPQRPSGKRDQNHWRVNADGLGDKIGPRNRDLSGKQLTTGSSRG